ncbi:MAG: Kae1-associated kinase Bud32 [Methanotrichaceae archaeon]|nr:Kae1-associated kinase Bud32 [Methanotrichaceae archaeon]
MEIGRGAEAVITLEEGTICKFRLPKSYRHPQLDEALRQERTLKEAKIIADARRCGVPTPIIRDISRFWLKMEHVEGPQLKKVISPELSEKVGEIVGKLHRCGIIHGDLTTSNMILNRGRIYLIDFGLAFYDHSVEAQGVDVHVYFQTVKSTHDGADVLIEAFKRGYINIYENAESVLKRSKEIKARGRYL